MDLLTISKYIVWLGIYSFIGWIYESGLRSFTNKRWYNSGFLNGPYIPIYGFGAILDIYFLSNLNDPIKIFLYSAIINCLLEYLTSWWMEKVFHGRWWNYSQKPLNINGRIYYGGFLAFGSFATFVILYFQPWLISHTTDLMSNTSIYICALAIVVIMSVDTVYTVVNMKDFEEKVAILSDALVEIIDHIDERIDNLPNIDKIKNIMENMSFQQRRLLNAFPSLKFEKAKFEAREIIKLVRENNIKIFKNR